MTVWKCVSCGEELPGNRRSDKHYCGVRCRVRAHRIRTGEGKHVRPARKHGHTALKTALAAAAAATAAAVAVELARKSQDARLAENERKIAGLEAQLRKSQTEKEDLKRAVEQVTREKKEKDEQLCQTRKELDTERETVKALRRSLESARQEREQAEQRLLVETETNKEMLSTHHRLAKKLERLLFDTSEQVDDLSLRNQKLARQLAEVKDKREVQLAKIAASKSHQQLQARMESAQAEVKTLKQRLRSVEGELSSSTKKLAAKAQQKLLPAARQALPASSAQTALAIANRSIEHLNSENGRLSKACMEAIELARQWKENSRHLAQRLSEVEGGIAEKRRIERHSQVREKTENDEPGFFQRALTAIGLLGTGVLLGTGAAAALGRGDSVKALGAGAERRALGPAAEQRALGPKKGQRLLPPKSDS